MPEDRPVARSLTVNPQGRIRSRRRRLRSLLLAALAAALLPAHANAISPSEIGGATVDVLILRPAGAGLLIVGAGLFVPTAILTSPMGRASIDQAAGVFVRSPYRSLVKRKIGDV